MAAAQYSILSDIPGWSPALESPDYSMEELRDEGFLTKNISQLWLYRQQYSGNIKSERKSIRALDEALGQMLFQMKSILARPGRNGGWSSWLKLHGIARATADRLVIRFAKARGILNELPHESITEPSEVEICKLFALVWHRVERRLNTPRSRYDFFRCFVVASGLPCRYAESGILMLEPTAQQEAEVSAPVQDAETRPATADPADVL